MTVSSPPQILRTVSAYVVEWGYYYPSGLHGDDYKNQFCFRRGAFDNTLARNPDIALTQDMNGVPFARTSDGTLRIASDETGLLIEADLLDSQINRVLCRRIDARKIRGWSHKAGWPMIRTKRTENGVTFTDYHSAKLLEATIVFAKTPRQKVRKTPMFLSGGPASWKVR